MGEEPEGLGCLHSRGSLCTGHWKAERQLGEEMGGGQPERGGDGRPVAERAKALGGSAEAVLKWQQNHPAELEDEHCRCNSREEPGAALSART